MKLEREVAIMVYRKCKFYLKGNCCSHKDAPEPYRSKCIGKHMCGSWEDTLKEGKATMEEGDGCKTK
jgi:hypothetical protein